MALSQSLAWANGSGHGSNKSRNSAKTPLVFCWLFQVVYHDNLHWTLGGFEFESELLLQCGPRSEMYGPMLHAMAEGSCIVEDVNRPPEVAQAHTRVCGNPSIGSDGTVNIYGATITNLCAQLGIAMDREVIAFGFTDAASKAGAGFAPMLKLLQERVRPIAASASYRVS